MPATPGTCTPSSRAVCRTYGTTYYLQNDGTYIANGERTNGTIADDVGFFFSDSWRVKPNLTLTLGARYQVQLPMTTDGLYSRPETWEMVYGITGANDSGKFGSGNLYKPGVMTGVTPVVVQYENDRPAYNTDWNNISPSVGVAWRPALKDGFLSKILSKDPVFRGGYSLTNVRLGTAFFDGNYAGNPGRSRAGSRTHHDGHAVPAGQQQQPGPAARCQPDVPVGRAGSAGRRLETDPGRSTRRSTSTIRIWPVPQTHQYSFGFQRELGKSTALDIRYVGNTGSGRLADLEHDRHEPVEHAEGRERLVRRVPSRRRRTCGRTSSPARAATWSPTRASRGPRRCRSSWRTSRGSR